MTAQVTRLTTPRLEAGASLAIPTGSCGANQLTVTYRDDFALIQSYCDLRARLINYVRRLGSYTPEDHADEAILRVLQNQGKGEVIRDLRGYSLGVVHNVFLESTREPRLFPLTSERADEPLTHDAEQLDECLTKCLMSLSARERKILKTYSGTSGQERIANRRQLAKKLGMRPDVLRLQVHRIRKRLGRCVENYCEQQQAR
jgi:DNA-directed RNA polymerase specialized sigma24 family protein